MHAAQECKDVFGDCRGLLWLQVSVDNDLFDVDCTGLLRLQQGSRSTFPAVKKAFRLLLDNVSDTDPSDIAYTYAGYAPLSIRLVEHALRSSSGEGSSKGDSGLEEALKAIPGPAFDVLQTVDKHGLPMEQPLSTGRRQGKTLAQFA